MSRLILLLGGLSFALPSLSRTANVPATSKIVSVDLFEFATTPGCAAVVG